MTEEELLQVIEQAARDGITELDLSGHMLRILPPEIGTLTQLKKLILGKYEYDEHDNVVHIAGNQLRILPTEINQLTKLQELHIVNNLLSQLPPEIGQLSNLSSLNISHN